MAYFTIITSNRDLTESESTQVSDYISAQQAAGTTTGLVYEWNISKVTTTQATRMWGTTESANGYKDLLASFNPAVPVSVY